jgi:beta-glucosidase/6-phospho-beta-glucosidase/beta-galactosidase
LESMASSAMAYNDSLSTCIRCGPDFAISMLHQHLTLHLANPPAGCNPHTLYLQFDNCSRENKNKYMPAYSHWLIHNHSLRPTMMQTRGSSWHLSLFKQSIWHNIFKKIYQQVIKCCCQCDIFFK